jgi:hypothetical protein
MGRDGSACKLPEYWPPLSYLTMLSVAVTEVGKLRPAGRIGRGKLLQKCAYITHKLLLFFKYLKQYSNVDQVKKDGMGGAWSTNGGEEERI